MASPNTEFPMAEYYINSHGNEQLIDGQKNIYTYHSGTKGVGGKPTYWRCDQYKSCHAYAVVKDGRIVNEPEHGTHEHFRNDARLQAKLAELEAIKKSEDLSIMPSQILKELESLPAPVRNNLSTKSQLLDRMKRRRAQVRKNVETPD